MSPIEEKYAAMEAAEGFLGEALEPVTAAGDGVGRYMHFQRGSIFWTVQTGAWEVHGALGEKWIELGAGQGLLGYPLTGEMSTPDGQGRFQHFQKGSLFCGPGSGAHALFGPIRDRWAQMGWENGFLGYPAADEAPTPDGAGTCCQFQHGVIYWTPETGAHEVHGAVLERWAEMGREQGPLGYPMSDETPAPDGRGRFNHFQHGSIFWMPETGAVAVLGAIRDAWTQLGRELGCLGYPIAQEQTTPGGAGCFSQFQNGSIYWTAETGAHEVHGAIRENWLDLGGVEGVLGYPVTDEIPTPEGMMCCSHFQGGSIYRNPETGACDVEAAAAAA